MNQPNKKARIEMIAAAVRKLDPRVKQQQALRDMDDAEFIARITEDPIGKKPEHWTDN